MTSTEWLGLRLGLALLAGLALGAFFFGGLWWTIRRSLNSAQPAAWFLGSLVLRTGLALTGFWFVAHSTPQADWRRLLACLLGFALARIATTWLTRAAKPLSWSAEAAR